MVESPTLPIFPPLVDKYSDFWGRKLVLGANRHTILVNLVEGDEGIFSATGGIDIDICDLLSEKLNFT